MTTAAPNMVQGKPGKFSRPIRLFSTGWVEDAKGREFFGTKELDKIVRNFEATNKGWTADGRNERLLNPALYIPPNPDAPANASIGHEADQAYLKKLLARTDNPAAGWVSKLWRSGEYLMGEVDNIPAPVLELLNSKQLRTCSAEVYRDYKGLGPTFRRVAFLGATPPERKDLGELPPVVLMSEGIRSSRNWRTRLLPAAGNLLLCFSEGFTVDRNALLEALAQAGVDVSGVGSADEAFLASVAKLIKPAASENSETPPDEKKPKPDEAAMFSERLKPLLEAAIAPLKTEVNSLRADQAKEKKNAAEQEVAMFCENLTRAGKLPPAKKDSQIAVGKSLIGTDAYSKWKSDLEDSKPLVSFHSEQVKAGAGANEVELNRRRKRMGLPEKAVK